MRNMITLNFSIGPVQGFIARARRTRDFWAGSFLLSYLAGQAMAVILESKGSLVLPAVAKDKENITDLLLQAVVSLREKKAIKLSDENLKIATLPNRFRAEVPVDFDPNKCTEAINEAWSNLCRAVWESYLQPVAKLGENTAEIWKRQINNFWEIVWVLGETAFPLEPRKNWRSHIPPVEPGDKCSLFEDLQELSGFIRTKNKEQRERQDRFWADLRSQTGRHELTETERLSAIALVKRLFPLVAPDILWEVPIRYPSTPYLAAVTWLEQVAKDSEKVQTAKEYAANCARRLPGAARREEPGLFPALQQICSENPSLKDFLSLDGKCFFKDAICNPRVWEEQKREIKRNEATPGSLEHKESAKELEKRLKELGEPVSPFYAMVLMDGDRLGALLKKDSPEKISEALGGFSRKVPQIVQKHNGITVYAGGDDVLALLPLEGAIPVAVELRKTYLELFDKVLNKAFNEASKEKPQATISGAVVYAHYTTVFTEVYTEAQRLLSKVAKDETGRDSLAVTVWKRAGQVITWSAPWEVVLKEEPDIFTHFIERFRKDIKKNGPEEEREFTTSFIYNLQSRLTPFKLDEDSLSSGEMTTEQKAAFFTDLITAEYLKSRSRKADREEARALIQKLLPLCQRWWRDETGNTHSKIGSLELAGMFLLKFLLQKGWKDDNSKPNLGFHPA